LAFSSSQEARCVGDVGVGGDDTLIVYGGGIDLGSVANVQNVAVETGVFLSHLQHLVVVKVRWR
jgi:hypothetical protein